MSEVNILGTKYKFETGDLNEPNLAENDGICELYEKYILIRNPEYMSGQSEEARQDRYNHVMRHEIIHAIAHECSVYYGDDESLVDWIAHIIPIVNKAILELNIDRLT